MLDIIDRRPWTYREGKAIMGRSYIYIICPFCRCEVKAYRWSLGGSGKLCPECGAKHIGLGAVSLKRVARNA